MVENKPQVRQPRKCVPRKDKPCTACYLLTGTRLPVSKLPVRHAPVINGLVPNPRLVRQGAKPAKTDGHDMLEENKETKETFLREDLRD